jgi:hypothetical protein
VAEKERMAEFEEALGNLKLEEEKVEKDEGVNEEGDDDEENENDIVTDGSTKKKKKKKKPKKKKNPNGENSATTGPVGERE